MPTRVHLGTPPADDLLAIYIRDHLVGAAGGLALARRAVGTATTAAHTHALAQLADEIEGDLEALRRCADALGIPRPRVREAGAIAAERLGRLKLNGQLRGTSPLSPVVELEALMLGVSGQRSCWRVLQVSGIAELLPADIDLAALEELAFDQRRRLEELHHEASSAAVGRGQLVA
jgi:hypothetical protein